MNPYQEAANNMKNYVVHSGHGSRIQYVGELLLLSPGEFILVLDKTGTIHLIDLEPVHQ